MPTLYTTLLANIMDSGLYTNVTSTTPIRTIINRGARKVLSDIDLRSTKRMSSSLKFFNDIYTYTCPTDLKGRAIIDILPQGIRDLDTRRFLANPSDFDRKKTAYKNMVAISDDSFVRKLKASLDVKEEQQVISDFISLTENTGTWTAFGDAENLAIDTSNYVSTAGSLKFDINNSGGTTAGVTISGIGKIDLTNYKSDGSAFIWAYITDVTGITNYILRLGFDSVNYYSMVATAQADATSFVNGWNLIRFDFSGKSTTGIPDYGDCEYVACYMTKDTGKVSETGYRFDSLVLHSGWYNKVLYYSKYPWQTKDGVWIANSTADTDLINADEDELELFTERCKIELFRDLKDYDQMKLAQNEYEMLKQNYKMKNPTEKLKVETYYY
jgi:hypothetical protein